MLWEGILSEKERQWLVVRNEGPQEERTDSEEAREENDDREKNYGKDFGDWLLTFW